MADHGSNRKVAHSLVAVSSAAVVAVYAAGYTRTRAAAERLDVQMAQRRPHGPVRGEPGRPMAAAPIARERPAPPASARLAPVPAASTPAPVPADAAPRPASSQITSLLPSTRTEATLSESTTPAPRVQHDDKETTAPIAASSAAAAAAASPSAPEAVANVPAAAATSKFKDGTYLGWGTSRHGDIQAAVVIEGGRITVARVEQCLTRYSCAWVAPIPPVILRQQGTTYDYVSGATESSDAFQEAIADALTHAQ